MSGFSSGGFKTAYIFNQDPDKFHGVGILSGSIGDLIKGKISRIAKDKTTAYIEWRKKLERIVGLKPYPYTTKIVIKIRKDGAIKMKISKRGLGTRCKVPTQPFLTPRWKSRSGRAYRIRSML